MGFLKRIRDWLEYKRSEKQAMADVRMPFIIRVKVESLAELESLSKLEDS